MKMEEQKTASSIARKFVPVRRTSSIWQTARARIAETNGPEYWRSLEELAGSAEFQEMMHREFPKGASEWLDAVSRRGFLKLMGASLAMAGMTACTKQPLEPIVPYVKQPEELVPGRPMFYRHGFHVGRIRDARAGREPHVPADQDRRQRQASREPGRNRHFRAGVDAGYVRSRPLADDYSTWAK